MRAGPLVLTDTEALAGLETGGIPLAVILGQVAGLPTRFVRKEAKPCGTRELAERDAIVEHALRVIDREAEARSREGVALHPLFRREELRTAAVD